MKTLDSEEVTEGGEKNYVLRIRKLLSKYKTDTELWSFLRKNSETMTHIKDLTIYRRSVEVSIEPVILTASKDQEAYALLKRGDIGTFNKRAAEFRILNLTGVDLIGGKLIGAKLSGAKLNGADLAHADLSSAKLNGADLSQAHLGWANLDTVDLAGADLRDAKLYGAILSGAGLIQSDLYNANLRSAKLIGARLIGAKLTGAILSEANLSSSLIIHPVYESFTLDSNTSFHGAIIDDPNFIDFIVRYTKNVPEKINNKRELKEKLFEVGFDEGYIKQILSISKLSQ